MAARFETKEIAGLLARLAVAAVLVYSGVVKALAPAEEFAYAIESYRVVGPTLALLAAKTMPWIELWAGVLLAAGVWTRYTGLFAAALFVFFELLLGQAWLRGLPLTSCGCFGSSGSNSLEREFLQNLVFLALLWPGLRLGLSLTADDAVREE